MRIRLTSSVLSELSHSFSDGSRFSSLAKSHLLYALGERTTAATSNKSVAKEKKYVSWWIVKEGFQMWIEALKDQ